MKILVAYYSVRAHVLRLAGVAAENTREIAGIGVVMRQVRKTLMKEILKR